MIRYLKIALVDGTRFILRVTGETPRLVRGIEVDASGDEIVPVGAHQRLRIIERPLIKKAVEMRMSPKYATLEVVPPGHATKRRTPALLDAEIAESLRSRPRGHARRAASPEEARIISGTAARLSEDAITTASHREAAAAHVAAAKKHKTDPAGIDTAWLHDQAAGHHRQAARARESRILKNPRPDLGKTFATYQEKLAAAVDHGHMAQEYARQALAAARKRS